MGFDLWYYPFAAISSRSNTPVEMSASSSTEQQPPMKSTKRKYNRIRIRIRNDYQKDRRLKERIAECKKADAPHTKFVRLANATASMVEQDRKKARPKEREENKEEFEEALTKRCWTHAKRHF